MGRPTPQRSTSVRLRRRGEGAKSEFVKNRRSGEFGWSERKGRYGRVIGEYDTKHVEENIVDIVCDGEEANSWSRCSARRQKSEWRRSGVEITDFGMIDGELPSMKNPPGSAENRLMASGGSGGSCLEQVGVP